MKLSKLLEREKKVEDEIKKLKSENADLKVQIYRAKEVALEKLCNVFEKKFNYGFHRVECNCGVNGSGNAYMILYFYNANNDNYVRILSMVVFNNDDFDEKLAEFDKKYADEQNRKALMHQIARLDNLYLNTDYLHNLPKTYTFLLCNKKRKTFCLDIEKLIATKILFFKIEKRKRSKDGQNDG